MAPLIQSYEAGTDSVIGGGIFIVGICAAMLLAILICGGKDKKEKDKNIGGDANAPSAEKSDDVKEKKSPDVKSKKSPDIKSKKSPDVKSKKSPDIKEKKSPAVKSSDEKKACGEKMPTDDSKHGHPYTYKIVGKEMTDVKQYGGEVPASRN